MYFLCKVTLDLFCTLVGILFKDAPSLATEIFSPQPKLNFWFLVHTLQQCNIKSLQWLGHMPGITFLWICVLLAWGANVPFINTRKLLSVARAGLKMPLGRHIEGTLHKCPSSRSSLCLSSKILRP